MIRGFRMQTTRVMSVFFVLTLAFYSMGCQAGLFGKDTQPGAQPQAPAQAPPVLTDGSRTSYAGIVEKVMPAVVKINVEHKAKPSEPKFHDFDGSDLPDFFKRMPQAPQQPSAPRKELGLGSGVIVSQDGTVLTNHHVIEGASKITVEMNDKRTFTAKVIGSDQPSDLAVLKIEAADLPFLSLGDSDKVRVGDIILAIGNPLGIGQTVTAGIISAKGRRTGLSDGSFEDFLQIDAPINRGNSGGALVSLGGELIGINSQILSPSGGNIGIGFSIPSNMAKSVMEQLLKDGKVHRGQLGIGIQPLTTEMAENLGIKDAKGIIVREVRPGSAAAKAGIKVNDVVVAINGERVEDSNTLRNKIASTPPGSEISLTINRDGTEQEVKATLDEFSPQSAKANPGSQKETPGNSSENGRLGLTLQPLTPEAAKKFGIPGDAKGLVVVDVDQEGPASEADIRPGDVILAINRQEVGSTDDVQAALEKAGDRPSLFLISRGGDTAFITIQPAK